MRKPIRNKGVTSRSQTTNVQSVPAPLGGWNARDSIANMNPMDAVVLKNFFPTTIDCVLRGGYSAYGTTTDGLNETLAVYNRMDGTNAMFACANGGVFDCSSPGVGTDQSLTVTNGRFQTVNFGDGTNNWLIMVNGVNSPKYYNGSWVEVDGTTSPALTGVTPSDLIHVCVYHGRLFFLKKSSLSFYYLSAGAAGGALTEFDLSSFADKGGYLMWVDTWSFDGGDGPDDYICFMTSEGQAIIYRGVDPSSATTWVRVGTYNIVGKPLGRRSHIKFEGDLIALTQSGAFPLSEALKKSEENPFVAVTNKIDQAFAQAAGDYGSNFGWSATLLPLKTALIINIPVSESRNQKQYVMNTITKAWCEFDSWDASCFAVFNDELYFGGDGFVRKAWSGVSDGGSEIIGEGRCAFNYFGQMTQSKRFNLFRPMIQVNGNVTFLTGFDIDFQQTPITGEASFTALPKALWDDATWDSSSWSSGLEIVQKWTSPSDNVGYCAAGKLKINTDSLEVHWVANDYVYETGGIIS